MHLLDPRTPEAQAVIEHQAVELCRRGVAECDVEDFKQEICLELWSKRQKYEPSRAAPITYMGLLARIALPRYSGRRRRSSGEVERGA